MKRIFFWALLIVSGMFGDDFNQLGSEIIEYLWRFHPVDATYKGIHKYDTLLTDFRPEVLRARFKDIKIFEQRLDRIDTLSLSVDEYIDYALLRIMLKNEIFTGESLMIYRKNPLIYVNEAIYGIYNILIRSSPSVQLKMEAIRARLTKIPDLFDQARKNLVEPPPILCKIAIEQLREGAVFFNDLAARYTDSLGPEANKEFITAKEKAVVAMVAFRYWLEDIEKGPATSYALGHSKYAYKLREIHLLDMSIDSILSLGQNMLNLTSRVIDSLKKAYQSKETPLLKPPADFKPDDVKRYRQWEIEEMRRFVGSQGVDYVTVPDYVGAMFVVETPKFLRGLIPGIAMEPPGPFDKSTTSYFYVRPLPERFDSSEAVRYYNYIRQRGFKGSVVHEGFPGHHLQLSIANQHPSPIRRSISDNFLIEGWALYCEELMARSGLYEDTIGAIIGYLGGVRFRSARVIVDVMLQTGQYDYEQAVNFMCQTFGGGQADSVFFAR
ncbi:MAG: DUF885 domain-containing protein, partial [candidate division WOR-3 bacterium]